MATCTVSYWLDRTEAVRGCWRLIGWFLGTIPARYWSLHLRRNPGTNGSTKFVAISRQEADVIHQAAVNISCFHSQNDSHLTNVQLHRWSTQNICTGSSSIARFLFTVIHVSTCQSRYRHHIRSAYIYLFWAYKLLPNIYSHNSNSIQ